MEEELARTGTHEQHAAVTEPEMGGLHYQRGARSGRPPRGSSRTGRLRWGKAQRDIIGRGRLPAFFAPQLGVTRRRIVTAVIAAAAQLFEDPYQRWLFTSRFGRVRTVGSYLPTRAKSIPTQVSGAPPSIDVAQPHSNAPDNKQHLVTSLCSRLNNESAQKKAAADFHQQRLKSGGSRRTGLPADGALLQSASANQAAT